jgi:hypothetical protein
MKLMNDDGHMRQSTGEFAIWSGAFFFPSATGHERANHATLTQMELCSIG